MWSLHDMCHVTTTLFVALDSRSGTDYVWNKIEVPCHLDGDLGSTFRAYVRSKLQRRSVDANIYPLSVSVPEELMEMLLLRPTTGEMKKELSQDNHMQIATYVTSWISLLWKT